MSSKYFLYMFFAVAFASAMPVHAVNETNTTNSTIINRPNITVEPSTISLTALLNTSVSKTITLVNKGNRTAVNVTLQAFSDLFYTPNNFQIPAKENRTVTITFFPTAQYIKSGVSLNVTILYIQELNITDPVTNISFIVEERIFDLALQRILFVNLDGRREPTSLKILLPLTNFTIESTKHKESVMIIVNEGNATAENIILSANYTRFSPNNFTLAPFGDAIIAFNISIPNASQIQVNMTHNITVKAKGGNFAEQFVELKVFVQPIITFIPPDNVTIIITEIPEALLETFCKKFPDRCPLVEINRTVFVNRTYARAFTQEELEELLQENADLRRQIERTSNRLNQIQGEIDTFKSTVTEKASNTEIAAKETKELVSNLSSKVSKDTKASQETNDFWFTIASAVGSTITVGGVLLSRFAKGGVF